jgi:hypothetical protein
VSLTRILNLNPFLSSDLAVVAIEVETITLSLNISLSPRFDFALLSATECFDPTEASTQSKGSWRIRSFKEKCSVIEHLLYVDA